MAGKSSSTKTKNTKSKVAKKGENHLKVWQKVLLCIFLTLLPVIGGSIITLFTIDAQEAFGALKQPPLAPPAWLFPVAWTILYLLMGLASYFIVIWKPKDAAEKKLKIAEIVLYFVQLAFNFAWILIFFNLDAKYFAFGWLIAMWLMILALMIMCYRGRKMSMWLLLPYILWCTFAAYLNISIAILN